MLKDYPERTQGESPGVLYKGFAIVCKVSGNQSTWYVQSVGKRSLVNGVTTDHPPDIDPLKGQSFATEDEAFRAGIKYGQGLIDSRP
jgi:hypothetical protein